MGEEGAEDFPLPILQLQLLVIHGITEGRRRRVVAVLPAVLQSQPRREGPALLVDPYAADATSTSTGTARRGPRGEQARAEAEAGALGLHARDESPCGRRPHLGQAFGVLLRVLAPHLGVEEGVDPREAGEGEAGGAEHGAGGGARSFILFFGVYVECRNRLISVGRIYVCMSLHHIRPRDEEDGPRTVHAWWRAWATQLSHSEEPHSRVTGRTRRDKHKGQANPAAVGDCGCSCEGGGCCHLGVVVPASCSLAVVVAAAAAVALEAAMATSSGSSSSSCCCCCCCWDRCCWWLWVRAQAEAGAGERSRRPPSGAAAAVVSGGS